MQFDEKNPSVRSSPPHVIVVVELLSARPTPARCWASFTWKSWICKYNRHDSHYHLERKKNNICFHMPFFIFGIIIFEGSTATVCILWKNSMRISNILHHFCLYFIVKQKLPSQRYTSHIELDTIGRNITLKYDLR